jgi:hypothetical protein
MLVYQRVDIDSRWVSHFAIEIIEFSAKDEGDHQLLDVWGLATLATISDDQRLSYTFVQALGFARLEDIRSQNQ